MKLSCPSKGGKAPECVIEHRLGSFVVSQGDKAIEIGATEADSLVAWLKDVERETQRWLAVDADAPEMRSDMIGDIEVAVVADSDARIAFAVNIGGSAFDLDAVWAVRTFISEALHQERAGFYANWY